MAKRIATGVYDFYGRLYGVAELLFRRRLAQTLAAVPFREGNRVLDIGVGTGISLEFYPAEVEVTGVDFSEGMLEQARRKVARGKVRMGCRAEATRLLRGDAMNLPFADRSFDVVVLTHVVTTVPDPLGCLAEAFRVARVPGTIVLVNHFRSGYPVLNWVETAIDPICRRLGWRSDLSMEELLGRAGVGNLAGLREAKGFIFRIVYLQKGRHGMRVVTLPAAVEGELEVA